jgi:hypothetical protein
MTFLHNNLQANNEVNPLRIGSAATVWSVAGLVIGAAGLGIGCALGLTGGVSSELFYAAYLTAFCYFLSIALGSLFFVILHHLCRAGWSVTVRRLAEAAAGNIWLMALLCLPIFSPRFLVYFALWGLLTWYFRSRSIRQDATGDVGLTVRMERFSAPAMIAFSFTLLAASVDLLMSRTPHWTSTIFALSYFSGCVLSALAWLTLLAVILRLDGRVKDAITIDHLNDLGNLTLGFVIFWGYIAFSQYMLIWYANLPEETKYYLPRQSGSWIAASIALLVVQLFVPFFGLLSRRVKRSPAALTFWALWLLAAHLLDVFWLVMPNLPPSDSSSAAETPFETRSLIIVLALVVGMGGLFAANTARLLRRASLVPVNDPRLPEALGIEHANAR